MAKIYLVHGWGGHSKSEPWFSWLEKKVLEKNIEFLIFDMPNTDNPKIEEWVKHLEKNILDVDEETFFIGHSIGCQTILRYIEKLPKSKKIGGAIFVAGWFNLINLNEEEMEIAHPWINEKIDFERILKHTTNFLLINSNNDPYVPLSEADVFKDKLGAKIIFKKGEEHFNNTKEIKEIIEFIQKSR